MTNETLESIESRELYYQYKWYQDVFPPVLQETCDEFFTPGFTFQLLGISKNVNTLIDKSFYFVTKVRIDDEHDMFFRASEQAISAILNRILGRSNRGFNLNNLTELETKIITAFNDFLFGSVSQLLIPPAPNLLKRVNFDMIHLTFLLKEETEGAVAKFVVSVPAVLMNPVSVPEGVDKFDYDDFLSSTITGKIILGTTRFSMLDVKELDEGDIVVFDESNIKKVKLVYNDNEFDVKLNPNLGLVMVADEDGGEDMTAGNPNLWDSIEVDMIGEFDAVKISLGDLKKIEQGMVVDLTSIYENMVTLYVEDKFIARGELVIINDRYGVKIQEVAAKGAPKPAAKAAPVQDDDIPEEEFANDAAEPDMSGAPDAGGGGGSEEDEFDYSDFELEDDI